MSDKGNGPNRPTTVAKPFTDEERDAKRGDAEYFAKYGSDRGFSSKSDAISWLRLDATLRQREAALDEALSERDAYQRFFVAWLMHMTIDSATEWYVEQGERERKRRRSGGTSFPIRPGGEWHDTMADCLRRIKETLAPQPSGNSGEFVEVEP